MEKKEVDKPLNPEFRNDSQTFTNVVAVNDQTVCSQTSSFRAEVPDQAGLLFSSVHG